MIRTKYLHKGIPGFSQKLLLRLPHCSQKLSLPCSRTLEDGQLRTSWLFVDPRIHHSQELIPPLYDSNGTIVGTSKKKYLSKNIEASSRGVVERVGTGASGHRLKPKRRRRWGRMGSRIVARRGSSNNNNNGIVVGREGGRGTDVRSNRGEGEKECAPHPCSNQRVPKTKATTTTSVLRTYIRGGEKGRC